MGWLVSQVVASMIGAVIAWKIVDTIVHGILGPMAAATVKASFFVSVWTAITTGLGMHKFKKAVRGLRRANKEVGERINLLPKDKQLK